MGTAEVSFVSIVKEPAFPACSEAAGGKVRLGVPVCEADAEQTEPAFS
jgi:hypothetical protein